MKRNAKLDGLRFLYAVPVFLLHSGNFHPEGYLFPGGALAVEFFLILSGYLMAVSIDKKCQRWGVAEDLGQETWEFLGGKLRAFMPELLASMIIGFFWMEVVWRDNSIRLIAKRLLSLVWEPLMLYMAGFGNTRIIGAAWYLSAMMLAMLILYPICRKYFSMSTHVIMPAIAIFVFGYFCRVYGTTAGVLKVTAFAYKGMIRAFAGIALGVSCFPVITALKNREYSKTQRFLLTAAETLLYLAIFGYMFRYSKKQYDVVCVLLITVAFCITCMEKGCLDHLFSQKICGFLGKYSLLLYLSHHYIAKALNVLFPERTYWKVLCLYVFLTAVNSGCVYLLSRVIRKYGFPRG